MNEAQHDRIEVLLDTLAKHLDLRSQVDRQMKTMEGQVVDLYRKYDDLNKGIILGALWSAGILALSMVGGLLYFAAR